MTEFAAAKRRVERLVRQAKDYPIARLTTTEVGTLKDYDDYMGRNKARGALSLVKSFGLSVPSNLGRYHVLNGQEPLGWKELERSWYLRSLAQCWLGPATASHVPCLLLHAIVRGDRDMAGKLRDLLNNRLAEEPADWRGLGLPAFALGLYARWSGGGDFEGVGGAYATLVANWNGDGLLSALNAACDHHLDAAFDEESVGDEFPGYSSIPIELLAIRAVRDAEALSTPALEHPFATTRLAQLPLGPTGYDPATDPWVERAFTAAKAAGLIPGN